MSQAIPPDSGVPRAFWGQFRCPIDPQGHLLLPPHLSSQSEFVLSKGLDGCLMLSPQPYFRHIQARAEALPLTDKRSRAFRRHLFASAMPVTPDSQHRIPIPSSLRAYAGLDKEAVLVGNDRYLEVWSVDAWERMSQMVDEMLQKEDWLLEGV